MLSTKSLGRASAFANSAVVLVVLTRLSLLIAAPVTLWLVATRRTLAEQGLFIILWNVQAVAQLMELGVGALIVQAASHEAPFLAWNSSGILDGDVQARRRLYQIIDDGRRWYGRVAIALAALGAVALWWLARCQTGEICRAAIAPSLLTLVCTAAYLPLIPTLCAIEGCGGLVRVQRMRMAQSLTAIPLLWVGISVLGALWGVAFFSVAWLGVAQGWIRAHRSGFIRPQPGEKSPASMAGTQDSRFGRVATTQWRTGATWLAWWLAPQSVAPILLATHGPTDAGQFGMSLAIATAPLTLALAWLQARYPQYGALLARGKMEDLGRLAWKATVQAASVCVLGISAAAAVVWLIGQSSPALAIRAMPARWIIVLGAANLAWLLVQSMGGYLRAWREEPLMETAIVSTLLIVGGVWIVAKTNATEPTVATYALFVIVVVTLLSSAQFIRLRRHALVSGAATRDATS